MNADNVNRPSVAVLIDADNISPSSVEDIFKIVYGIGEPIYRRAYGMVSCFANSGGWAKTQREYGIVARPQVSNVVGKNVADIALVIDAMTLLYKGACNGICIVSSDSDFTALAAIIREEGKAVYGIGGTKAPESFRKACTQFYELKTTMAKTDEKKSSSAVIKQPTKTARLLQCPRCGEKLMASRTKSNQDCKTCPSCGGMTAKLSMLGNMFAYETLAQIRERAAMNGQPGCVCPDCGSQMNIVRVASGKQHVEIDVCPNCEAIWYDKDEFERLVPNDGLLKPTISAGKTYRREMIAVLTADLRIGKLLVASLEQLQDSLKNVYHVPGPDISPLIGTLRAQKIIAIDSKTGKVVLCK
ncbi:MAG: NYN domain-containing protein [Victivallales bacterium]|nr:NYN domain-containing protein [Victivallales bacterium]